MDASLQKFLDELTEYCRVDDASGIWKSNGTNLSFAIDLRRDAWAFRASADVATSDMMIVASSWAWRADNALLQVGHSISHHSFDDLDVALERIAHDLPAMITSELLSLHD